MLNNQQQIKVQKRLIVFYIVCCVFILVVASLTWAWWDKGVEVTPQDVQLQDWQLVYAKIAPSILFTLFTVFNIWI